MPSVTNNESTGRKVRLHGGLRCAMVALVLGLGSTQAPAQFVNEQKLVAAELVESLGIAYMGVDIDVSGNTILVGAFLSSCDAGSYCGSAYIYRFNGTSWNQTQSLTAVNPVANGRFGSSVSISETIAVANVGPPKPPPPTPRVSLIE